MLNGMLGLGWPIPQIVGREGKRKEDVIKNVKTLQTKLRAIPSPAFLYLAQ